MIFRKKRWYRKHHEYRAFVVCKACAVAFSKKSAKKLAKCRNCDYDGKVAK